MEKKTFKMRPAETVLIQFLQEFFGQLIVSSFFTAMPSWKEKTKTEQANSEPGKLLFSQQSAWRYVWGRIGEENNLSHPPHLAKESTSIRPRFPYWLINCSAKYSALHYSSCRQDVSFAAKFQGQVGYRNVIEIKLADCAVGAGRSEHTMYTQEASFTKTKKKARVHAANQL